MKDDIFITLGFIKDIREMINNNFNNVITEIEKDYSATLKTYLNDSFIVPYTNIINEKTNLIIDYINEKRNLIKGHLDNYLTLESEIILEEINLQINKTLDLINEYNYNFNIFKMPDEFIQFLNDYGTNNIKPIYEEFKTKIDKLSNTQIISNFEKNVNNYQNSFNLDEFLNISNTTFLNIKNNYIDNMTININNYYSNYSYNFEKEVVKENNEKIINIEETFQKLLKKYDNAKIFIEALKEFNDYDKTIIKNINNLNIAYKESQKLIKDSNNEEDINNNFYNKLNELKEMTMDYYNKINESYYNIRQYLNESLINIYDDIDKCINISYETLINEYKKLVEEEESINEEYSNNEIDTNYYYHNFEIEGTTYYIEAKIKEMKKYAKFNFDLLFEDNNYKNPKLLASIINKSRPKSMILDIFTLFGYCGKKGIIIESFFNDTNFKMNLDFNVKSEYINTTTITNFEKYEYTTQIYEKEDSDKIECFTVLSIKYCINSLKCKNYNNIKSLSNKKYFYDKKYSIRNDFIGY